VEENKDSNTKHRYGEVMQAQLFSDDAFDLNDYYGHEGVKHATDIYSM